MSTVLFAPHNDDEALFAAFQILRLRPTVVICLFDTDARTRESAAACEILGAAECVQWHFPTRAPNWNEVRGAMEWSAQVFDSAIAPAPHFDENGHSARFPGNGFGVMQHDMIGHLALEVWGEKTTLYETYTRTGRVLGQEVKMLSGWLAKKLEALACYRSQHEVPTIQTWFVDATLREYVP